MFVTWRKIKKYLKNSVFYFDGHVVLSSYKSRLDPPLQICSESFRTRDKISFPLSQLVVYIPYVVFSLLKYTSTRYLSCSQTWKTIKIGSVSPLILSACQAHDFSDEQSNLLGRCRGSGTHCRLQLTRKFDVIKYYFELFRKH